MNFSKVMVLPLLMSGVVSVASAGSYINNYGEYSKTHEQVRPVVVSHSDSVSKRSGYDDMSVRFFMGLDAALFQYDNVRASADGYRERDYNIKINHKILENTGLSFGADINDGYKVYLLLNHYNNKVKVNGDSTNASSQTNLGLALDIPVLKQESITPFIRVGLEYTWVDVKDSNHMKGHGLGYMAGVGLSHNFTDNIYGNVYLTYEFAHPDVKVSGTDLSYKQDALVLGLGLGYRF